MNYPVSFDDSSSLPNPTGVSTQNSPDHAALHTSENQAIIALEQKIGINSSTPTGNKFLWATGLGQSAWTQLTSAQLAASLTDETGSGSAVFATSPSLVTPKVDTINELTPSNGTTIGGVNIKSGALNTNNSVVTSNITNAAVTSVKAANGFLVQVVKTETGAVATGSTVIPLDDTIPQSTEGDQYMSLSITPKATTNTLVISAVVNIASSVANNHIAALFQDATANALAVTAVNNQTINTPRIIALTHTMTAGTTSSTTFKIRAGGNAAGTTTFNGTAAARLFGGVYASSIVIMEYNS